MVVDVSMSEQSKDVHGVFQVVNEMWDETLMKSVGSASVAGETEDTRDSATAVEVTSH